MWKFVILLGCFVSMIHASPVGIKNMEVMEEEEGDQLMQQSNEKTEMALSTLNLPSNATSIRADLTDEFTCKDLPYGYYADVDNDCQVFHVCLPVAYADGKENMFRWSFICPEFTIFNQESFTCMRPDDMMISCKESAKYYELNRNFGMVDSSMEMSSNEMDMSSNTMMADKDPEMPENEMQPAMKKIDEQLDEPHSESQSIKVDVIKNRRKPQGTRRTSATKQRIRTSSRKPTTTTTTTTPTPTTTTTMKYIEPVEITEKPIEKTTPKYHQRFTRRPEIIKENKKKIEIPVKIETILPAVQPKRKRPVQVALNSNTKTLETVIRKEPSLIITVQPENELTTEIPIVVKQEITEIPIMIKNEETIISEPKKEVFLPAAITEQPSAADEESGTEIAKIEEIADAAVIIQEPENTVKITEDIMPSMMSETQDIITDDNRIPIQPAQFINVVESMPHDNNDQNNQQQQQDQQSMIINLISSLVNAEHSKVEEEKFDNAVDVQNFQKLQPPSSPSTTDIVENQSITPVSDVDQMPTLIPQPENNENLNSERVVDQENIKLKATAAALETVKNLNIENHQSHPYDQMTHIPIRILPLLPENTTLPIVLPVSDEPIVDIQKEQTEDYITANLLQSTEKNMESSEKTESTEAIETISMPDQPPIEILPKTEVEKLETEELATGENLQELVNADAVEAVDAVEAAVDSVEAVNAIDAVSQLSSAEIEPIFHRDNQPSNLLKPEELSVIVDEQPIVHEIEEPNKIDNLIISLDDLKQPSEIVMPILEKMSEILDASLNDKKADVIVEAPVTQLPTIVEIKSEEEDVKLDEPVVKESPIEASAAVDTTRLNMARSLRSKMDPRKRRFLFKSDAS